MQEETAQDAYSAETLDKRTLLSCSFKQQYEIEALPYRAQRSVREEY